MTKDNKYVFFIFYTFSIRQFNKRAIAKISSAKTPTNNGIIYFLVICNKKNKKKCFLLGKHREGGCIWREEEECSPLIKNCKAGIGSAEI